MPTKVVDFHQQKVEAIIQAPPPRHYYISEIDLGNIISDTRMYHLL